MGFLDIFKSGQVEELQKKVTALEDELQSIRTQADLDTIRSDEGVVIPRLPFPYSLLYDFYKYSDILRIVIDTLTHEVFRNGWTFEKKYEVKCVQCGREYSYKPKNNVCENCGSNLLEEPDPDEISELERMFKEGVNENKQTLLEVLLQVEKDVNIYDDGYLLILKDYYFNENGELISARVKEILRGNPQKIQIIADEQGRFGRDEQGREIKTCVEHRNKIWKDEEFCPLCGRRLFTAYYVAKTKSDKKVYYIKDECLHISKFNPSLTYGFSPIYAVWQKVVTLWNMDRYIRHYYEKERPPKALLLVNTRNEGALRKAWDWLIQKTRQNPHLIYPLAIESDNKNFVQYLKLSDTLDEMQFIEARNELRRTIGAIYGVMPLFQGDIQMSGGLNNEGLQVTITNRAVERAQAIYNEKVFPFILRQFGIDGWNCRLVSVEARNELTELQIEAQKIQNARMMLDMGFKVERDEKGNFQFSGEAKKPELNLGINPFVGEAPQTQRFEGEPTDVRRGEDLYEALAKKEIELIEKQEGKKFILKQKPEFLIEALKQVLWDKLFAGYDKKESKNIVETIIKAIIENWSENKLKQELMDKFDMDEQQAERITRTEMHEVESKTREISYKLADPEGKALYKWINPLDTRTTPICRELVERTKNGVPLERLKELIKEVANKYGSEAREFTPHIGCRSVFIRVF